MHGNSGKEDRGARWIPSNRYEECIRSNKAGQYEKSQRESDKPNTQLGSSSATGAGSGKGRSK